MTFLVVSIVGSIVLTVLLNLALRSPRGSRGIDRGIRWLEEHPGAGTSPSEGSAVRFVFPWKAMLVGSLLLTIVLNLVIRLF